MLPQKDGCKGPDKPPTSLSFILLLWVLGNCMCVRASTFRKERLNNHLIREEGTFKFTVLSQHVNNMFMRNMRDLVVRMKKKTNCRKILL